MRNALKTFSIFVMWIFIIGSAVASAASPNEALERKSRLFVESMRAGTAGENPEIFSDQMRQALEGINLTLLWQQLESQMGPFVAITRFVHMPAENVHIILAVTKFQNAEIALRLVFDQAGKIAGLQVVPAPPVVYAPPPAYADTSLFTETETLIPCGDISLPAKLTMPRAKHQVPVVILVHGSGPHDMDQTIGPNKTFRDLAWGLSSRGIAVIRYEKRTLHHAATLNPQTITPWEETGADAVSAIRFAETLPGVDPRKIFVLGHSLGGMMAPMIAKRAGNLAGVVILGGNSGKLYDLVVRQLIHLAKIQDPDNKHGMQSMVEQARAKAITIAQGKLKPHKPDSQTLLNLPVSYWNFIRDYDQVATAVNLNIPMLILQGERDYQVDMQEFEGWKTGLAQLNSVKFITYPYLNHLFFAGEGMPDPAEYHQPHNVDARVVNDIASWILDQ